jgi:hypothetical protein
MSQVAGGLYFPPPSPLTKQLLFGLVGLYVVEVVVGSILGVNLTPLLWLSIQNGFQPWQFVTRWFLQRDIMGLLTSAAAIYFILPAIRRVFTDRIIVRALVFSAVAGSALAFAADLTGLLGGAAYGLSPLLGVMLVLFGLHSPDATISILFVIPVPAKYVAWGTGVLTGVMLLGTMHMMAAVGFFTWLAAIGWWFLLGPRARVRVARPKRQSKSPRFTVYQGGQDDVVH